MKKKRASHKLHYIMHFACLGILLLAFAAPRLPDFITKLGGFIPTRVLESEIINTKTLKIELENKDFTLINVHTPYSGEILKTDSFIEYDSLIANKDRLPKDKNAKIVLYCQSGNMSGQALKTLKDIGYTNVRHLQGGLEAWEKSGFEVVDLSVLPEKVTPKAGFTLPVSWEELGPKLIALGVIDKEKFEKVVYLNESQENILVS